MSNLLAKCLRIIDANPISVKKLIYFSNNSILAANSTIEISFTGDDDDLILVISEPQCFSDRIEN